MDPIDTMPTKQLLKSLQETDQYAGLTQKQIIEQLGSSSVHVLRPALKQTKTIDTNTSNTNFTPINDINLLLLYQLDDATLVNTCQSSKKLYNMCKQDKVLKSRIDNYVKEHEKIKWRIARAVYANKEYHGSSRQFIKKYLETNYKIEPTDPIINSAIKMLTAPEKRRKAYY